MFRGDSPFGLDLAALNIQRGRDHGLRCYNDYLEVMGAPKLHSFDKFPKEVSFIKYYHKMHVLILLHPLKVGRKLARVYRTPDDIDLWVGGLLEKAVEDGIVGQTFSEIIADQFTRFKNGDRYYYEYNQKVNPTGFRPEQLQQIRKTTMARLICDNADHLHAVPLSAFVRPDFPG